MPRYSEKIDGYPVGVWVVRQRELHAKGTLDPTRADQLKALPGWSWDPRAAQWETAYTRLLDYVERYGHASVSATDVIDGHAVGKWVGKQRLRNAKGTLDPDRARRLQGLPGWAWNTHTDQWDKGFNLLVDYIEGHGNARVSQSHKVDGYPLGQWVAVQRDFYRTGRLAADRRDRLEGLPGWTWDPYADQWEESYWQLQEYVKLNGNANVPRNYSPLGRWVSIQRHAYSNGTMDPDRQRRLQDLSGWTWNARAARWEEGYSRLLRYVQLNGHARPGAKDTVDGYPIGTWVIVQRHRRAKGILDPEREDRLKGLPGWTWDSRR